MLFANRQAMPCDNPGDSERGEGERWTGKSWTVRTTGTHTGDGLGFPATNKSFETVSANLGRIRDGQAVEHWSEQGMFPMLMQLGVLPPMGG